MQYLAKLLNNDYGSTGINKISSIIFGLLASILITRYMGPELKGMYSYIINFVSFGATILNLGIYQSYPYNKRQNLEDLRKKYLNIYFLQFTVYMITALIGYFGVNDMGYALGCFLLPLSVLTHQISNLMLIEDIKFRNAIHIINSFINVLLSAIIFLFATKAITYVIFIVIIKDIILIVPFLIKIRTLPNPLKSDMNLFYRVVKFGTYPMLTALLITANYRVDVLFLKEMVSLSQLGMYSIGLGLAEYAWIIPDIFKEVLMNKTAKNDSIESIKFALRVSICIVFMIIVAVILLGEQLLLILYGESFVPAYQVTILLFAGIPSMVFFKIIGTLFVAQGQTKFYFFSLLISVVVKIMLNLLLVPEFGINGSAFASAISYSICGFAFLIRFISRYNINLLDVLVVKQSDIEKFLRTVR